MRALLKISLLIILITTSVSTARAKDCPELVVAAGRGDYDTVNKLLNEGCDINSIGISSKYTALITVASNGNIKIAKLLISNGADPNINDSIGNSALSWATKYGYIEIVKLLLEKGASVNTKDSDGYNMCPALASAAGNGHAEIVKLLFDNGGIMSYGDEGGNIPLYAAIENGHLEVVKLLFDKGAYADNITEGSPLIMTTLKYPEIVKLFLDKGVDINISFSGHYGMGGVTPLMYAAFNGYADTVKLLIERGADINLKDAEGKTALMWTNQEVYEEIDYDEVIKILKEAGAKE